MLVKLLKHEFWATGRIFLPFYLAVLATGVLTGLLGIIGGQENTLVAVVAAFTWFAYIFSIVAALVVTFVVIVVRFYRNFLSDEGHLMFTLPVTRHQLVLSKIIVSFTWQLVSILVSLLSIVMVAVTWVSPAAWAEFSELIGQIISGMFLHLDGVGVFISMSLLTIPVSVLSSILMVYAAMAIGQLFSSSRVLMSVIAYFVLYSIVTLMGSVVAIPLFLSGMGTRAHFDGAYFELLARVLLVDNIVVIIFGIVCYFVTVHLLSKRLNLL